MDDLKLYAKNEKGLESLVQTVGIFNDDIGMKFGISKCATLALKKGKIDKFRIRELCKRVQKNFAYCCRICGYRFDWANPRNYN